MIEKENLYDFRFSHLNIKLISFWRKKLEKYHLKLPLIVRSFWVLLEMWGRMEYNAANMFFLKNWISIYRYFHFRIFFSHITWCFGNILVMISCQCLYHQNYAYMCLMKMTETFKFISTRVSSRILAPSCTCTHMCRKALLMMQMLILAFFAFILENLH